MSPTSSFPSEQHLRIRPPGWPQGFAGADASRHVLLPRIDGYRLERRVGQGRTSSAYLAEDLARGGKRVLKVLRPEHAISDLRIASFLREFVIPFGIRHPHVVRVDDQCIGDGYAFISMEYLGAGDLARLIRCGLTAAEALAVLRQAASGLAEVHRNGVVHCDVKPTNLLLRYSGDIVLADFGLARPIDWSWQDSQPGLVVGTPCYASPELSTGARVGAASDIYSLGAVFYEMLCGKPPFPGHTLMEVLCQHLMAPVPRLPRELARFQFLIDSMLAKEAGERPQHGQALLEQIDLLRDAGPVNAANGAREAGIKLEQ